MRKLLSTGLADTGCPCLVPVLGHFTPDCLSDRATRRTPVSEYFVCPWGGLSGSGTGGLVSGGGHGSKAGSRRSLPRDAARGAAEMPCTWSVFLVLHKEKEEMHGDRLHRARHRGAATGANLLSSRDHLPRPAPLFLTRLGPPRDKHNTQKQGCGVLLSHLQTVRRKMTENWYR